jgi:hypothetical protein
VDYLLQSGLGAIVVGGVFIAQLSDELLVDGRERRLEKEDGLDLGGIAVADGDIDTVAELTHELARHIQWARAAYRVGRSREWSD